eukprot:m.63349 g.63349  ORF g.63349 m.63349 type:complete len:413 (+) comp11576_c0_seq3:160-1398(+)
MDDIYENPHIPPDQVQEELPPDQVQGKLPPALHDVEEGWKKLEVTVAFEGCQCTLGQKQYDILLHKSESETSEIEVRSAKGTFLRLPLSVSTTTLSEHSSVLLLLDLDGGCREYKFKLNVGDFCLLYDLLNQHFKDSFNVHHTEIFMAEPSCAFADPNCAPVTPTKSPAIPTKAKGNSLLFASNMPNKVPPQSIAFEPTQTNMSQTCKFVEREDVQRKSRKVSHHITPVSGEDFPVTNPLGPYTLGHMTPNETKLSPPTTQQELQLHKTDLYSLGPNETKISPPTAHQELQLPKSVGLPRDACQLPKSDLHGPMPLSSNVGLPLDASVLNTCQLLDAQGAMDEPYPPKKARKKSPIRRDTAQQAKERERKRVWAKKNREKRKRKICRIEQQIAELEKIAEMQKQHQKRRELK